jgi:hypothetical protein
MALHKFKYVGVDERVVPGVVVDRGDGPETLTVKPGDTFEAEGLALADEALFERVDKPRQSRRQAAEPEPEPAPKPEAAAEPEPSNEEQ